VRIIFVQKKQTLNHFLLIIENNPVKAKKSLRTGVCSGRMKA